MTPGITSGITSSFKKLGKEIFELKNKLNSVNDQKEFWFKQKEGLKKDIGGLIHQVKKIKLVKDRSSEEIQELKKQRDKYNKEVKDLIHEIKEVNKIKEQKLKESKIKIDPSKIQERIDSLELNIETEAPSFKEEKRIMKQIKDLKKVQKETAGLSDIVNKSKELSNKIEEAKTKAESYHKKILDQAKGSKLSYEDFLKISKEITALKEKQEEAFQKFIDSKKDFQEVNTKLQTKLSESKNIPQIPNNFKETKKEKQEAKLKEKLEQKSEQVEEKLKKKKKLTTEDLLVFQGNED